MNHLDNIWEEHSLREKFLTSALSEVPFEWDLHFRPDRVASSWFSFSSSIPNVLINLVQKITSNELKCRIVSIINEELGEGNPDLIHARSFYHSCFDVGIEVTPIPLLSINFLKDKSQSISTEFSALGFCLGLEIIANENIEFLFSALTQRLNEEKQMKLRSSEFFETHFLNEDEHIDKNVENFKSYIKNKEDLDAFMEGFDQAIMFWSRFWQEVGEKCE